MKIQQNYPSNTFIMICTLWPGEMFQEGKAASTDDHQGSDHTNRRKEDPHGHLNQSWKVTLMKLLQQSDPHGKRTEC